jgi:hypothetical protein
VILDLKEKQVRLVILDLRDILDLKVFQVLVEL